MSGCMNNWRLNWGVKVQFRRRLAPTVVWSRMANVYRFPYVAVANGSSNVPIYCARLRSRLKYGPALTETFGDGFHSMLASIPQLGSPVREYEKTDVETT